MIIALTGFMGCGKSSVGKILASLLSCSFADLDTLIESGQGRSIPDIFKENGEEGFRAIERDTLKKVISESGDSLSVLSLGGGTLTTEECARLVKEETFCIYLRASIGTLVHNLENDYGNRPMLNTGEAGGKPASLSPAERLRERIVDLMRQRAGVYEDTARIVIDIDGKSFQDIASQTAEAIKMALDAPRQPKGQVWDPLRKKEVKLTPEEAVRQWCIKEILHGQMRVPMHMMMSETGFKLGDKQFRADILVYDRNAAPLAVVECKRPETVLDRQVLEQAIRYNMVLDVRYIIITNGRRTFIFKKGKDGYSPCSTAPVFEEMLQA